MTKNINILIDEIFSKLILNQLKRFEISLDYTRERSEDITDIFTKLIRDFKKLFNKNFKNYNEKIERKFAPLVSDELLTSVLFSKYLNRSGASNLEHKGSFADLFFNINHEMELDIIKNFLSIKDFFQSLSECYGVRPYNSEKLLAYILDDFVKFFSYLPTAIILDAMYGNIKNELPGFFENHKKDISQLFYLAENIVIKNYPIAKQNHIAHEYCEFATKQDLNKNKYEKYIFPDLLIENPEKNKEFLLKLSKELYLKTKKDVRSTFENAIGHFIAIAYCRFNFDVWYTTDMNKLFSELAKESFGNRLTANIVKKGLCTEEDLNKKKTPLLNLFFCSGSNGKESVSTPLKNLLNLQQVWLYGKRGALSQNFWLCYKKNFIPLSYYFLFRI
ncbi:MAG: hypothetical protein H2069_04425 [Legionella sp.]|nr:hypothetical protein [Legionella sp.]